MAEKEPEATSTDFDLSEQAKRILQEAITLARYLKKRPPYIV